MSVVSKEEARANLKADFDKDTVVDLLCGRIDELEEQREELLEAAKATRAWMDAAATRGAKVPMQAHELRVIVKSAIAKAEGVS